ncbi:hypothetical protein [Pseudalkalibacillus hwajinpoensis]|uniref:hypothetical protein n=1 Tax=Guptibacillus hwajinpoensis TaxID=208199 RepID=UPI00146A0FF6|nr:hypothetical protein [Pseudalkalibacillus hwajinpoensis]
MILDIIRTAIGERSAEGTMKQAKEKAESNFRNNFQNVNKAIFVDIQIIQWAQRNNV